MKFDDLFMYTGDIGTFQILILCILCYASIFGADPVLQNFIGGSTMQHWCAVPALSTLSHDQQRHVAIPMDKDGEYYSCEMYDLDYGSYTTEELLGMGQRYDGD